VSVDKLCMYMPEKASLLRFVGGLDGGGGIVAKKLTATHLCRAVRRRVKEERQVRRYEGAS
jgi:hypothetical protein